MTVTKRSLFLAMALGAAVASCRGGGAEQHQHGDDEHADHDEGEHSRGEEGVVRIDRSMLRDLRTTLERAESRPSGESVSVLGDVRLRDEGYAEIGSSVVARVARVLVAPGDLVATGQPLVELESTEVASARAALEVARAHVALAERQSGRRHALADEHVVAERVAEEATYDLAAARSEERAARTMLDGLGASRGSGARFVLTSPIAGTVIERSAIRGRVVDASSPLVVVGDLTHLWVVAHAFERDALRIRIGAVASVTFPALPNERVTGVVTRIGSRVDPASRTLDVRIEIDNPTGVLRPGMSATASTPVGDATTPVITVPIESVQRHGDAWCVFIPRAEEGVFEIRAVGRGRDLGGDVEILSGLRSGESVVVQGAFLLKAEADKARGSLGGHDHGGHP